MKMIQMKTHKLYIIKKRLNNKVLFVEFIFNSRQFKLMTTDSQPHGARWPRFNCVHIVFDSVSLIFGVITCAAGITGVSLGLYFASLLRKVTKKADPLVCGIGLIASAPFLYLAIVMSSHNAVLTWV